MQIALTILLDGTGVVVFLGRTLGCSSLQDTNLIAVKL